MSNGTQHTLNHILSGLQVYITSSEECDFSDTCLGGDLPQSGHWTVCPDCAPPPQIVSRPQFLPCFVLSFTVLMFSFETIFSAPVMWWELDTAEAMVGSLCSQVLAKTQEGTKGWVSYKPWAMMGTVCGPTQAQKRHIGGDTGIRGHSKDPTSRRSSGWPMATGSGVERESSSKKNSL